MKYRKLRIAWSVACGFLCLLLIALWVRSYWYVEKVLCSFSGDVFVYVGSAPGVLGCTLLDEEYVDPWIVYKQPAEEWRARGGDRWLEQSWGGFNFAHANLMAPYWFWLLMPAILAAAPWLWRSNRYSLRTLLIGITVVAAVLGLAMALTGS
jgi:hypothetical protein